MLPRSTTWSFALTYALWTDMDLMRRKLGFTWRAVLLALFIGWIGVSAFRGLAIYRQLFTYIDQTSDLLSNTDTLLGLMKDAETGQRGYLLTGKPSYLEPFMIAERDLEQYQDRLERPINQLSVSREGAGRLRVLIREKMAELNETIVLYRGGRRAEALALVETDRGKLIMDQIRLELTSLRAGTEKAMLGRRQAAFDVVKRAGLMAILGSLAVLLLVTWAIKHDAKRIRRDAARISDLNRTLEEKVDQLAESNRELEAFCYSVSHDLRAPLRTVEGFAAILTRDYSGQTLDDRGLGLLKRMGASAVRMGQLIDDLLNLSRISRTELESRVVDLSALATAVTADLQERDPARNVEVRIESGVSGIGDAPLLRVALENLLGNAWKIRLPKSRGPGGVLRSRQRGGIRYGARGPVVCAVPASPPGRRIRRDGDWAGYRAASDPASRRPHLGREFARKRRIVLFHGRHRQERQICRRET
jgi:CHASE3 domain sensor protein